MRQRFMDWWSSAIRAGAILALAVAVTACGENSASSSQVAIEAQVLSSPAHLVSGGNALIDVSVIGSASAPLVLLNGADVSSTFQPDPKRPGHHLGLVQGIANGENALVAQADGASVRLSLTGYPISGPMIAGPLQQPFICQSADFGLIDGTKLGPPLDDNCMVAPRVNYLYMPTGGANLVWMSDTTRLPADVAMTTTELGVTVPFVVRMETRIIGRGIYQSTVLHDPTSEPAPTALTPPKGWNRGLIAGQGVGCAPGWYIQGLPQAGTNTGGFDVRLLSPQRLGAGYALYGNTLMHGANNCNPVLLSEVSMMSKEQFVKTHGRPDYTIAVGCSGGSYSALQAADRVPGLYDGVLVLCTFPDGLSSSIAGTDARLLLHYFDTVNPSGFSAAERAAVTGYFGNAALVQAALNSNRTDPVPGRVDTAGYASAQWSASVPAGLRYDPVSNPTGARPTVYDTSRNYLGVDTATGFALRPYDNVGVQYGLKALNAGSITVQQFLDLNERIGGVDTDANYAATRSVGDAAAIRRAYQSGLILNGGGGLASIPVFDVTGVSDEAGNYHQQWQHFALRERLRRANGDLGNMMMWRGLAVDSSIAMPLFFDWVRAFRADTGTGTQRAKALRTRPAAAKDGCFSGTSFIAEDLTLSSSNDTPCNVIMPSWTFPRYVAGGPLSADVLKCTLKAPNAADYTASFEAADWQRLLRIFPQGVCDWSKPGQGQSAVVQNGSFGPSRVNLVFDIAQR